MFLHYIFSCKLALKMNPISCFLLFMSLLGEAREAKCMFSFGEKINQKYDKLRKGDLAMTGNLKTSQKKKKKNRL